MSTARNITEEVRNFIVSNFLYGQARVFQETDSFLAEGIVDSTGVLQLVAFLEETYSITIDDEDLTPENLDSLRSVAEFVGRKTGGATHAARVEPVAPGGKA